MWRKGTIKFIKQHLKGIFCWVSARCFLVALATPFIRLPAKVDFKSQRAACCASPCSWAKGSKHFLFRLSLAGGGFIFSHGGRLGDLRSSYAPYTVRAKGKMKGCLDEHCCFTGIKTCGSFRFGTGRKARSFLFTGIMWAYQPSASLCDNFKFFYRTPCYFFRRKKLLLVFLPAWITVWPGR